MNALTGSHYAIGAINLHDNDDNDDDEDGELMQSFTLAFISGQNHDSNTYTLICNGICLPLWPIVDFLARSVAAFPFSRNGQMGFAHSVQWNRRRPRSSSAVRRENGIARMNSRSRNFAPKCIHFKHQHHHHHHQPVYSMYE